jgi:hypothetical protein
VTLFRCLLPNRPTIWRFSVRTGRGKKRVLGGGANLSVSFSLLRKKQNPQKKKNYLPSLFDLTRNNSPIRFCAKKKKKKIVCGSVEPPDDDEGFVLIHFFNRCNTQTNLNQKNLKVSGWSEKFCESSSRSPIYVSLYIYREREMARNLFFL